MQEFDHNDKTVIKLIAATFLVCITLYVLYEVCIEPFTGQAESAKEIYKLERNFKDKNITFKKFKDAYPDADAVEYFDVLKLHDRGRFNVDNIMSKID